MVHTYVIQIIQNSQDLIANTSNITVKAVASWDGGSWNHTGQCNGSITIDGTKYTFTGIKLNPNRVNSGSQTVMTKTVNVNHNSDGTKRVQCSSEFYTGLDSAPKVSASWYKDLTTIPRKSTLSVANGTLGTAQTLTVTEQSAGFTHTITYSCGSASGTICTKATNNSISWTPPLSLASQNTTGTSLSIKFTITTYNGDTSVGSNSYTKTFTIPASVKPSLTMVVSDPTGNKDKYGGYILGISKIKVDLTGTRAYDSPIASCVTTANGKTYYKASFTTDALASVYNTKISATITDSRGRTASAEQTIQTIPYSNPQITKLTVSRCNQNGVKNDKGDHVIVTFSGRTSNVWDKNTASYSLEYKKSLSTNWTTVELTSLANSYKVEDYTYIFPASGESSYNVRVTVKDAFNESFNTTSASSAFTLMSWLNSGLGFAIGKVAELPYVFDVAFRTRFVGGILHPVLEAETDLDTVRVPNTYVGANISRYAYVNCPLSAGTFTLEVVGMGNEGQVKQRITSCDKTAARAFERVYHQNAEHKYTWGDWICVSDYGGTVLWSGGYYMTAAHSAVLSEAISKQRSGIVLVFSEYINGASSDTAFHCEFIPKRMVKLHPGKGYCFQMSTSNLAHFATKYLYIYDTYIDGHDNNNLTGASECGITRSNTRFVLRYVIGV